MFTDKDRVPVWVANGKIYAGYRLVCENALTIKRDFRNHWDRQIEKALANVLRWLLSKRGVQQVVADAFGDKTTPLCKVLDNAVEDRFDNHSIEVEADDVRYLDRYVSDAIEQALSQNDIDADGIKGLDDAISEAIANDELLQEELTKAVMAQLVARLKP